ncbi:MAG: hypothetical protein KDD22_07155 [Bdellovibrionales bacterium]|nr:hypothetical protein [Bdellovibrionales bacterium]
MKSYFSLFLFFISTSSFGLTFLGVDHPRLEVTSKTDLSFRADDLLSDRIDEVFTKTLPSSEVQLATQTLFSKTLEYLPKKYWPSSLQVVLESSAFIVSEIETGVLPLSMVNSYQLPRTSMIQIGMFELENDLWGYRWVVGHELGHMIVEWASRKAGSTDENAPRISFWEQTIYEGVGDYFAGILNENNDYSPGSRWYYRNPFRFKTLTEAMSTKDNSITRAEVAFRESGLLGHPLYEDWLSKAKAYTKGRDPYMPGSWLAGRLLLLGRRVGHQKVAKAIIELAVEGKKISHPKVFLEEVNSYLIGD